MKHNAYDFDKTIYKRDSTMDFYLFCLKKHPAMLLELPLTGFYFLLYVFRVRSKTEFKEKMYRFLRHVNAVDELVLAFWAAHKDSMADYYKVLHRTSDIVISASPEFLLQPLCNLLGIQHLIASKVDRRTGLYEGENCHGGEKVRRLREVLPEATIDEFYSDSLSDAPMAKIAEKAYLVRHNTIVPWPARSAGGATRP